MPETPFESGNAVIAGNETIPESPFLGTHPIGVALIDANGDIFSRNKAWSHPGGSHPLQNALFGSERIDFGNGKENPSSDDSTLEWGKAAHGIRSVLDGQTSQFSLDYPIRSFPESRWFRLEVTPIGDHPTGDRPVDAAVLVHIDVTNRKGAEMKQYADGERYRRQRNALVAFAGGSVLKGADPAEKIRWLTETAANTLGVARASVWRYNSDRSAICCVDLYEVEPGRHTSGMELAAADYPNYFRALSQLEVIAAEDAARDHRTGEFSENYLRPLGISAMLDAPIHLGGLEEGVLCHEHIGRPRCWMPDEEAFAVATANLVSLVLEEAERKEAEVRQRQSEAGRRGVWESSLDSIVSMDQRGLIVDFNPAAEHMFGRSRADAVGRPLAEVMIPAALIRQHNEGFQRYLATGEARVLGRRIEVNAARADGTEFPVEMAIIIAGDPSNPLFIGTIRDISARKAAEGKIREQAALLDLARDAILVRDLSHRILFWNQSAERLYGWNATEAVGAFEYDLIGHDAESLEAALADLMVKGEWTGEVQQETRDGRRLTVESRLSLVLDDEGKPGSILAINHDVTERREIEAQYLRAQRMDCVGTLAGGIAHDLNNVLSPIMMSIDLLKMRESNPASIGILTALESSAKRGADIVRQVLTFARGVEGRKLPVRIDELVREIEKLARETFPKSISVASELPGDLRTVRGDPTQIHQVLLNLCINARDALPFGGLLSLRAGNVEVDEQYSRMIPGATPGLFVKISVEDNGIGMTQEVAARIYEPFFTTKEPGSGTGLGLSTSLSIVRDHGGFLRLDTEEGRGTRFDVYFPAEPESVEKPESSPEVKLPRGSGETILLVDDEPGIREITGATLIAFGYRVITAADGAEAVSLYASRRDDIDLVLTDMMMPGMDGLAGIQVLLRMNPELKIIAASGLCARNTVTEALSAGVRRFLPKPFPTSTLLVALREVLEG